MRVVLEKSEGVEPGTEDWRRGEMEVRQRMESPTAMPGEEERSRGVEEEATGIKKGGVQRSEEEEREEGVDSRRQES